MTHPRRTIRTAWLALYAMLLAALVPALGAALDPREDRAGWIELCTAQGAVRWVVDPAAHPDGEIPSASSHAQCPFCAAHAPVLPSSQHTAFGVAPRDASPRIESAAREPRRTRVAWSIPHPRAPPPAHA